MKLTNMSQSTFLIDETQEIKNALTRVGLNISETEVNQILQQQRFSLEDRKLSELGSLFILASAVSATKFGKTKKHLTFEDLPAKIEDSTPCMGIPLYFWHSERLGRCGLYLTLVNGKPGLATCYECSVQTPQSSAG